MVADEDQESRRASRSACFPAGAGIQVSRWLGGLGQGRELACFPSTFGFIFEENPRSFRDGNLGLEVCP